MLEELPKAQKVRIGGLVQLAVRVKLAPRARTSRNPATGEEISIGVKPGESGAARGRWRGEGGAALGAEGMSAPVQGSR